MLSLSDTVKIAIIISVFSALMTMITCILYKLSKLQEVVEKTKAVSATASHGYELISIGLPWRRDSWESGRNSECSICKLEKGTCGACLTPTHQVITPTGDQEESVFTGRLSLTIQVQNNSLVLKHIIAEDLLPWKYTSTAKTFVTMDFHGRTELTHDTRDSEAQMGLHRVSYEQEFKIELGETDLAHEHFILTVWQVGDEECEDSSTIGECNVTMDTVKLTSAPDQSVEVSRKLYKRPSKKVETEILLSLSYLPTAERLSVVVMKAKNIEMKSEETITKNRTTVPNPYVKVCLIYAGRKIKKKKTSVRRHEKNPVYNESMIFDVPANFLHKIGFLITIEHKNFETEQVTVLGRIVMGSPVHNDALSHWNAMLARPRRPIAAWHKVFYLG